MTKINDSFVSMVETLFLAFEARQRGDRIDVRGHLETASEQFHDAVDEEIDRIEKHKRYMIAISE